MSRPRRPPPPGPRRGRRPPDWVIKVGGSLAARPPALRRLMHALGRQARRRLLLVVPGGGGFADAVRRADRRFALGAATAHWMAILAMDQYGHLLADLAAGARVVHDPRELAPGRLNVLAPSAWLREADPLPRSWDVTSDSIAAWITGALGARRLVLLKDVDGFLGPARGRAGRPALVRRAAPEALAGVVDPHFARALPAGVACWLVRGSGPARLRRLLETGRAYGTEVEAPSRSRRRPSPGPRPGPGPARRRRAPRRDPRRRRRP